MRKYFWRGAGVLVIIYLILVAVRTVHFYNQRKTDEQVAKINATRLTLDDVMGKNLPSFVETTEGEPNPYDETVAGIDANKNGIRDDVELAIFNAYPDSAKTRAVLLQYALALQLETIQPIVNKDTVTAITQSEERAYKCVGKIISRNDLSKYMQEGNKFHTFIDERQINNDLRKKAQQDFYEKLGSHSVPDNSCDLDLSVLPN